MDEPTKPACLEQQRLIDCVQERLIRIIELTHALQEAVANRNENLTRKIDQEIEEEIGGKERALGALRQHQKDHGC